MIIKEAEKNKPLSNAQRGLHPAIDDVLAKTYGVMVYQEDLMNLVAKVLGISFTEADNVRRAVGKKKPEILQQMKQQIFDGFDRLKIDEKSKNLIWDEILSQAGYSFNKAHSTAYSLLSFQCMFYKHYYRKQFYTELLNTEGSDKHQKLILDIIRSGIEVKMPHINKSTDEYVCDDDYIYAPLLAIRGVGLSVYRSIEALRPFHSIEDFMSKVPKSSIRSNVRKALWYIGAFEGLDGNFEQLEAGEEDILNKSQIQNQFFDYVILPKDKIDEIYEYASKKSCIGVGLVAKVENKVSKKGNHYRLVTLLPQTIEGKVNVARVFDDGLSIEEGQILAFRGDSGIVLRGSDNMRILG